MKYTVTIQQPVQEEQRRGLEQQLSERFGLNAEQAGRLSGRRTGRLMKPTSRARAELLLDVFQLAGAAVALEEVPEETQALSEPFQGVAPGLASPQRVEARDEAFLAPLLPSPAWPPAPSGFETGPAASPFGNADPFAAVSGGAAVAAPAAGGVGVLTAPQPPAIPNPFAPNPSIQNPFAQNPAGFSADPFAAGAPAVSDGPPADVWSDFTGSLSLPDTGTAEPPSTGAAPSLTTTMVPVVIPNISGDGATTPLAPRRSLTRQLTLGTLAPLALSSVVTLGVLALAMPSIQRQSVQQNAQTMATLVGINLGGVAPAQVGSQLSSVVATPGVGFVQAELAGRQTILRAQDGEAAALGQELSTWLAAHPDGGLLKLGENQYVVAEVTFQRGSAGQAEVAPAGAASGGQILRRVVVGIPNTQANTALRTTLLLVLMAGLLGLLLASLVANRAARQITDPIDRLVKAADAISMGDLSRPVQADRNDEIGDLAQALERMRQSLEAAMERLRRRRKS